MPTQRRLANAIRALAMDAVEAANSGHPGMPMGMADAATALFTRHLKFDPTDPHWPDRDRFVLSAGHGSMLIYALLHLTGYAHPTIDEIKNFRQLSSPCAGHPENFMLPGVETTTGPLGQGLASAVGLAIAERHLNAIYGDDLVDHRTYVLAGDGCLMEGVNHEAIGLAGHLKLGRLIVLWDDNRITIDGSTDLQPQGRCGRPPRGDGLAHGRVRRAGFGQGFEGDRGSHRRPAAVADPLQDGHRLRRAQQAGHRRDAWLAARRRRSRRGAQGAGLGLAAVRDSGRRRQGVARGRRPRRQGSDRLELAARAGQGGLAPGGRRHRLALARPHDVPHRRAGHGRRCRVQRAIATNGTVSFGFNGSWTGSNPVPASFTLNGTVCTGGVSSGSPSVSTSPSRSASASPSTSPNTSTISIKNYWEEPWPRPH